MQRESARGRVFWQREAASEVSVVGPLDPMVLPALLFLLDGPLARDHEGAVLTDDLQIFTLNLGEFDLDTEGRSGA